MSVGERSAIALRVGRDRRRRVEQRAEVVAGSVEGLERLVEQPAQLVLGNAVDQRAELIEHRADLLRDRGVARAITEPSCRYGGESARGSRSTYCSPTADTLRTSACRSAGIFGEVSSDSVAVAASRVTSISVTLPTCTPRYVTLENRYRPPVPGSSSVTVIWPTPEQRRHLHVGEDHHHTPTIDAIVKMISWIRTKRVSISRHPRAPTAQARRSVAGPNGGEVPTPSGYFV